MLRLSGDGASAVVDRLTTLLDGGRLRFYTGGRPSSAAGPLHGNTLLVELRFRRPAFRRADDGAASAFPLEDGQAEASGAATFFRALTSDGITVVCDGTVGTQSADLIVNSTLIQQDAVVAVSSVTITAPKGA